MAFELEAFEQALFDSLSKESKRYLKSLDQVQLRAVALDLVDIITLRLASVGRRVKPRSLEKSARA